MSLEWFDVDELYAECKRRATAKRSKDAEIDVFLYNCRHMWQECIDRRLDEVSEMMAWGLCLEAPTIVYEDGIPLMPPAHLTSEITTPQEDLPPEEGLEPDFDFIDIDARGFPMTLYSPVLARHMARLIRKTWGGSVHDAIVTIRLWDEEVKRGELLHNLLVAAIFGLWPVYDEAHAKAWLEANADNTPVQGALF